MDHTTQKIPYGYCQCGCGQLAPIAKVTDKSKDTIKGQPRRFIQYHHTRGIRNNNFRPIVERFWEKVNKLSPNECWEWQGSTDVSGYGQIYIDGRPRRAHRHSWELHNGPIPDDLWVLHKCDNPPCVNPDHLFLGTSTDNVRDMLAKGRNGYSGNRGESHPSVKLSMSDVREIRRLWSQGISQSEMARLYKVSQATIWGIVRHKTWTHI